MSGGKIAAHCVMQPDVLLIGGGLAGLSAAVQLTDAGHSIVLVERSPQCGGRARSFRDAITGEDVDNGQHIMMGCYHETLRYLERIGSRHLVDLQPPLRAHFRENGRAAGLLSALPLPPPLHALSALLRFELLTWHERMAVVRAARALLAAHPVADTKLQSQTVEEWLNEHSQPERCKRAFWNVLAIGMLNEQSAFASASLFVGTMQRILSGKRTDASIALPLAGLSRVLIEPAVAFLQSHGSEVMLSSSVESFSEENGRIRAAVLRGGRTIMPRAVISAVPFFALDSVANGFLLEQLPELRKAQTLLPAPIVSIHLWLDREIMEEEFAALLGSPIQWMFNTGKIQHLNRQGCHLSLVVSSAWREVEKERSVLAAMGLEEVRKVLPAARNASLIHSLVVKEKRATFSPRPGSERLRPSHLTAMENFFLAGDWTATGLPATIEGAVISGVTSANAAVEFLDRRLR